MTREVRLNLIFLVCLCVFSAPGLFILVRRTLNGQTRPAVTPDPVPAFSAYMQPPPLPPNLPRVEPRVVRDWVTQLLHARLGPQVALMRAGPAADAGPVVSSGFVTQLAGLTTAADGSTQLGLVRWDDRRELSMHDPAVAANVGGRLVAGRTLRVEPVSVPVEVRHALQNVNFVDPPTVVWWVEVALPTHFGDPPPSAVTLRRDETSPDPHPELIRLAPQSPATQP